jgi:uncharacterized lipoprotein YddW (UPF0748 family)
MSVGCRLARRLTLVQARTIRDIQNPMSFLTKFIRPRRSLGAVALCLLSAALPSTVHAQPAHGARQAGDALDDAFAPPPPLVREFRGVWLSPVNSGRINDWPSRPGLSADQQKAELIALLDRARDVGLNAVVLHVRMAGDALYPSKLAPWSAFLSGTSGQPPSPAYDPLQFAIDEAHARGLQLHAWFNPFRAMLPVFRGHAAPEHVTRAHPSWIRKYGSQTWIDPGIPAARQAVLDAILEVVERYDIDGVHLDDYFYPYRETETVTRHVGTGKNRRTVRSRREIPFPDEASWERYGKGRGYASRSAWRRANVDDFVEKLYQGVKERKPTVLVGISPFGIWRSGVPDGVYGLDAYEEIYADSRRWLREGWLDYIAPQLYWEIGGTQDRFRRLDAWWRTQNPMGRHIWPGLFTEREDAPRNGWTPGEIGSQIEWLRAHNDADGESWGHVHFRLGAMRPDSDALGGRLHETVYAEPALVPPSPWLAEEAPGQPSLLRDVDGLVAAPARGPTTVWWLVQRRYLGGPWQTQIVRAEPGAHILSAEELEAAPIVWVAPIGADGREGPAARLGEDAATATPSPRESPRRRASGGRAGAAGSAPE